MALHRLDIAHVAGGELGGANFRCLLVDPGVDLAPGAPFGTTELARVPLAFAVDLDAGAIDQQVQRPPDPRQGILTFRVFWRRWSVLKSGTDRSRPIR